MVKKTVRFALMCIDDFTGKCITQGGHVFCLNGKLIAPIHKPEGFYVFMDPVSFPAELTVSGGHYCSETLQIQADRIDPAFPVVRVRLMRKSNMFSDCEYLEGTADADSEVYALKQGGANRITAYHKHAQGVSVSFSGYFPSPVVGVRFMIGNESNREMIVTGDYLPDKTYLIEHPPEYAHKPGEAAVRVYTAKSDSSGHFSIPVEKGQKDLIQQVMIYRNEENIWECLSVTGHK